MKRQRSDSGIGIFLDILVIPPNFLRNLYPPTRHFLYVLSLEDLGDTPRVCIEPKGVIRLRRGFGGLGCILNL